MNKYILFIAIIFLITTIYLAQKCNELTKVNASLYQSNQINKSTHGNTTIYSTVASNLTNINELKRQNKSLYNQLIDRNKTIAALSALTYIYIPPDSTQNAIYSTDSIVLTKFKMQYNDSSITQDIQGHNTIQLSKNKIVDVVTAIDTNRMKIKLNYSITKIKDGYSINAYTQSNHVKIDEMNGCVIIPTQKKISIGLSGGFGLNSDCRLNDIRAGWFMGVGLNYRIF